MIPTLEFIQDRFSTFNNLCFGGLLPQPQFKLSRATRFLGQLCYKKRRGVFSNEKHYGFVIKISILHDIPEQEVEDTILHEMIHLYIASNNIKDTACHGEVFRAKMEEINTNYARHISIRHKSSKEELDKDDHFCEHFICIVKMPNGDFGIVPSAKSRIFENWRNLERAIGLTVVKWIYTFDPFFNRFPRCLTPKIYRISAEELEKHTFNSSEMIKVGSKIVLK